MYFVGSIQSKNKVIDTSDQIKATEGYYGSTRNIDSYKYRDKSLSTMTIAKLRRRK